MKLDKQQLTLFGGPEKPLVSGARSTASTRSATHGPKLTSVLVQCREHGLTEGYESSPGLCRTCHARRAYAADRRTGRAAIRLFGPADGVKPHRDKWGTLSFEVRKAELIKQRQIDATNGVHVPSPPPPVPQAIPPELARLRKETAALYGKADRKIALRREGYVYGFWHPRCPELVKIGRSGDPYKRLISANTWCPEKAFKIAHMEYFDDCVNAEAEVHKLLYRRRIEATEWFEFDRHDFVHLLTNILERN